MVVVVVVLALTRTIKSVVTGQAVITLAWKKYPREKAKKIPKVVHVYHKNKSALQL